MERDDEDILKDLVQFRDQYKETVLSTDIEGIRYNFNKLKLEVKNKYPTASIFKQLIYTESDNVPSIPEMIRQCNRLINLLLENLLNKK